MLRSWIILAFVLVTLIAPAGGTAHIYLRADEALWLVSDTLLYHNDGQKTTVSHRCKVAITKGRLIFYTGFFQDASRFIDDVARLPSSVIKSTEKAVERLLLGNRMDMDMPKDIFVANAEVVQVTQGKYEARRVGVTAEGMAQVVFVDKFSKGILHGFADVIQSANTAALQDPTLLTFRASHPREALLKLMNEETVLRPDLVGPPFTIVELYPDGSISDYSEQKLCNIPKDALHHPKNVSARTTSRH